MVSNREEKWSRFILLAYLIFALIGSSAVSAGKALCFEHSNNDSMGSGGYFSTIDHAVDWLAENVITVKKARSYSNSLSQNGLFRVFILAGTIAIAMYLAGENLKIIKNDNISILKNHVLLNLRI